MTDLILFDLDGTLIESRHLILTVMERTAESHGLTFPGREAGLGVVGKSLDLALQELYGLDAFDPAISETYKRLFGELREEPDYEERMFPDVPDMLTGLSRRARTTLGIATGKTRAGVNYVAGKHGWEGLFRTIQTADVAPSKPDPGMILQAMAEAGGRPSRTVMIGDSVHDMRMAKAAGVRAIAVDWGFQPASMLVAAGADLVAPQVAALPELIGEVLAKAA